MRKNESWSHTGAMARAGGSGRLSAAKGAWQSAVSSIAARVLPVLLLAAASPAPAAMVGELETLPLGAYACELPGSAAATAGIRQPREDFAVLYGSRYAVAGRSGIYLLTGDLVQMTSGPWRGRKYRRFSTNVLRKLDARGENTPLRCVRGAADSPG